VTTPDLSVDAFRALARSSPWRWRTLHFRHRSGGSGVEAWIRRPGEMLVVTDEGRRERHTGEPTPAYSSVLVAASDTGEPIDLARLQAELTAAQAPTYRPDGLVAERPGWPGDHEDPMYRDYQWVAMLDPHELAHSVEMTRLREDTLHGRRVWRADLRALPGYDPRCGSNCCELLWSEASWYADFGGLDDPDFDAPPVPAGTVFPDHYDVALDVQTGVVVLLRPVGETSSDDRGFENEILEVDADLDAYLDEEPGPR